MLNCATYCQPAVDEKKKKKTFKFKFGFKVWLLSVKNLLTHLVLYRNNSETFCHVSLLG